MQELPEAPPSVPIRLAVVCAELSNDVHATSLGKGRLEELRPSWSDLELVNHPLPSPVQVPFFAIHSKLVGRGFLGMAKLRTVENNLQLMVEFLFPLAG